jgi:hypothetical protein
MDLVDAFDVDARWESQGFWSRTAQLRQGETVLATLRITPRLSARVLEGEVGGQRFVIDVHASLRHPRTRFVFKSLEGGRDTQAQYVIPSRRTARLECKDLGGRTIEIVTDPVTHVYSGLTVDGTAIIRARVSPTSHLALLSLTEDARSEADLPWLVVLYYYLPYYMASKMPPLLA